MKKSTRKDASSKLSGLDAAAETALLWKLEDAWLADRLSGNSESTMSLLDDEYQGATSVGVPQTKADFVASIQSGSGGLARHVHSERTIKFHGGVAISTGTATLQFDAGEHTFRYLRVYGKIGGEWRLIASQSTPKLG
jgi:hypothetical protein